MAASDLYPLSSDRGTAIPLEIVRPKNLVMFSFGAGAEAAITIPALYNICWLYATKDCILKTNNNNNAFPAALVSGTNYPDSFFIPASIPMIVQLTPGFGRLLGLADAGNLYINDVQQWAGIALSKQTSMG